MNSYKIILKTTGLFASLRVITILVTIGTSKLISFLLGASGMGFYGILTSVMSMITSVSDLGVSKSSIRNISEARGENNHQKIIETVAVVSKLIFLTGGFGGVLTILLSYHISILTFGNSSYWFSFVLLGAAVFFTVIKNGQAAIFQGLRKFQIITKNTIISSVIGFLFSVPLIYFFGESGVLYAILATAIVGFVVSKYFINRLEYRIDLSKLKLTKNNSISIIKLGLAMMWVSFLVALSGYIIRAYISVNGSLDDVGFFQAGFQIISGYFGIIFSSMVADFFPRISAVNKDNDKLESEVNQQAIITLLLICPLVVILPYIMPYVVSILYTPDFSLTVDYVNFALFGIIFQSGSQTMGMILIAKNDVKVYTLYVFFIQAICLLINIIGYSYWGIFGLGVTFSINMLIHLLSIQFLNYKLYNISFNKHFLFTLIIILIFSFSAFITKDINGYLKYIVAFTLTVLSILYTVYWLKKLLNIQSLFSLLNRNNQKNK